jgi:hypothetical protein
MDAGREDQHVLTFIKVRDWESIQKRRLGSAGLELEGLLQGTLNTRRLGIQAGSCCTKFLASHSYEC